MIEIPPELLGGFQDMRVLGLLVDAHQLPVLHQQLAVKLEDVIARYKDALRPAIILIPGKEGSLGVGKRSIQSAIERAVGADIL